MTIQSESPTSLISMLTLILKYIKSTGPWIARLLWFRQVCRQRMGSSLVSGFFSIKSARVLPLGHSSLITRGKLVLYEGVADAQLRLTLRSQQSSGNLDQIHLASEKAVGSCVWAWRIGKPAFPFSKFVRKIKSSQVLSVWPGRKLHETKHWPSGQPVPHLNMMPKTEFTKDPLWNKPLILKW